MPAQAMLNWLPNFSQIKSSVENYYKTFVGNRLLQAAAEGNVPNIEFWLKWGASIEFSRAGLVPLHLAVFHKKHAAAEFLLKNGANIRAKDDKFTFLRWAIVQLDQNMLKLLLRYKADIDKGKRTQLYQAAEWGKAEMVIILLAHGASLTKILYFEHFHLQLPAANDHLQQICKNFCHIHKNFGILFLLLKNLAAN